MATAATRSFPYDVQESTEDDWREMFTDAIGSGIVAGQANEGAVTAGSGRQVLVATLHGWVAGAFGAFDAQTALALGTNATGSTRIDLVVLRNNFTSNQIELDIHAGTAGAGVPTATVNSSMHETVLARVSCASGYTNLNSGNITDVRHYVRNADNQPWGLISYVAITADVNNRTNLQTITGMTTTVATAVDRRLKVTAFANSGYQDGVTNDATELLITMDGTIKARGWAARDIGPTSAIGCVAYVTTTAVSHAFAVAVGTTSSFDVFAGSDYPAFISVEDVGPA